MLGVDAAKVQALMEKEDAHHNDLLDECLARIV